MSMVLAVFDDTRAAIASDGHAVQYDGETPFVTRTDCRKIYRVRSGQLVGRVGQSVLCSQLDSILRHFSGSFESCCDVARQFLKDCQPFKGEKPLGALSLIIIGRDSEGRVVAFESGRAFDDSITENVYRCDPGIRGFLAAGLTKNATELDAIVEGLPDASDFAKFLQTGLQQINAAHPNEVGGDFFAEELDGASYQVMDGPTYGRTLQTALTSGQIDLSKTGVINRVLSNIADDANFAKVGAGNLSSGKVKAAHISDQNLGFITGSQTFASGSSSDSSGSWVVVATTTVNIPAGTSSVTFKLSGVVSGSGSIATSQMGIALYTGAPPATPDASHLFSGTPTSITVNNPTTGASVTLAIMALQNSHAGGAASVAYTLVQSISAPLLTGAIT